MGQKLTSDMRLVDYYYQDGTHPNALGSQGLVEGMFLNSQKQIGISRASRTARNI